MRERLLNIIRGPYVYSTAPDGKVWQLDRRNPSKRPVLAHDPNFVHERVPTPSFIFMGRQFDTLLTIGWSIIAVVVLLVGMLIGFGISGT